MKNYLLYGIIYITMFFFGFVENIKGVSFPLIKMEFGVNYESQGGLVSLTWLGYVIFCFVASLFLQRFGAKRSMLMGYTLICLGALATLVAPSFWTVTLTLLIVNTGFGFFEVGTNALGTVVFTTRTALMMSLMHFFYGFGAILGPKVSGVLTDTFNLTWRQIYVSVIVPLIIVGVFIAFTKFKTGQSEEGNQEEASGVTFLQALKNPLVWLFSLTLGFMEVIEFGASNWGGLFLKDVYGLDPSIVGASFVSMFYILFTLSRLFSGLLIERIGYIKSLIYSVVITVVIYTVGFSLGRSGIWVLPVTGIFIAIMFPTMISVVIKTFGKDAPIMASAIITLSGAVNGVFQMVIGLTNQYAGEAWGYRSCLIYGVVVLALLYLLRDRINNNRFEFSN